MARAAVKTEFDYAVVVPVFSTKKCHRVGDIYGSVVRLRYEEKFEFEFTFTLIHFGIV